LLCRHIRQNGIAKGFYVDEADGYLDHMHCLMLLRADWAIAKQMQMIKGEAANWANKTGLLPGKLAWADEYFAASVSENKLGYVRNYIRNQEEHHRKITFDEEYDKFMKSIGADQG
jgi:putative transposase